MFKYAAHTIPLLSVFNSLVHSHFFAKNWFTVKYVMVIIFYMGSHKSTSVFLNNIIMQTSISPYKNLTSAAQQTIKLAEM